MRISLQDKVALVTGGGRGIGLAIARVFARAGARVAILSRTETSSKKAVDAINADFSDSCKSYVADVADFESMRDIGKRILADFSRIDILVNNAGITRDRLFLRMSSEDWDEVIETNLSGAFNTIKALQKSLLRQKNGRIINVSSVVGLLGNAGQANYAASKAGLIGLTKSLARELAGRSITVNAICPGFIETDMTSILNDDIREHILAGIPMKRFGDAEDIASIALFLASEQASYITGQAICVDGGMRM